MTVAGLKKDLGLTEQYPVYVTVNGVLANPDTGLCDGDKVIVANLVSAG